MKKTKFPALVLLAALCLSLFGGVGAAAAEYASAQEYYVQDGAGVLSQTTKDEIVAANNSLYEGCGAQIVVATVEFTGSKTTERYATDLANQLEIGDAEKDNGILLLLVTGAEDYWCIQGSGLERTLPTSTLSQILQTYLEPDFAAGDYDAGVQKTFAALAREVASIYDVTLSTTGSTQNNTTQYPTQQTPNNGYDNGYNGYYEEESGIIIIFSVILFIIAIIVVVNVVRSLSRPRSNYYNNNYNGYNNGYNNSYYNGGYQDHSFRNAFLGSWLANLFFNNNNRRPPRGGGGFGGFGGFGGGGGGGFSGGGFGGGGFGGGGFSGGGGGGFRGGGAGRGR